MANNDWDVVEATPLAADDAKHPAAGGLSDNWNVVDTAPVNGPQDWVIPPSAPNADGTKWAVPPRADIHAHRHSVGYFLDPTENAPTAGDVARAGMSGAANAVEQVPGQAMRMIGGELGSARGPGGGIFSPVVWDIVKKAGDSLRDLGTDTAAYWSKGLTPAGKAAAQGDLQDHPLGSIVMSSAQSAPGMATMALPTGPLTRAVEATGIAEKAIPILTRLGISPDRAARIAAAIPSSVGAGVSEGTFSGLQNAEQTGDEVRNMDPRLLHQHPYFKAAKAKTDPSLPDATRNAIATDMVAAAAENNVAISTGFWDTLTSMLTGGGLLGQLERPSRGFLHGMLSGAKGEGAQELVQSGGEQLLQNVAAKNYYDRNRDIMDQVPEQALIGGGSGALLGLSGGGAHGLAQRNAEDQPESGQPQMSESSPSSPETPPVHVQTIPQTPLQAAAQVAHDATIKQAQWEPIEVTPVDPSEIVAAGPGQTRDDRSLIVPDTAADLDAQVSRMFDPSAGRDSVLIPSATDQATRDGLIAKATEGGASVVNTPAGVVVTTNPAKAEALRNAPDYSQEQMGRILFGSPVTPKEMSDGTAIVARTPEGAASAGVMTNRQNIARDADAVRRTASPADTLEVTTADKAVADRLTQPDSTTPKPDNPNLIHGIRDGQVAAAASRQPNGQYEIYWGNGPSLLQSQKFRRQTVASAAHVSEEFGKAWLTSSVPAKSAGVAPVRNRPAGSKAQPKRPRTPAYGSQNKLVTKARADEVRAKLKAKFSQLNSGIDPEMMALGTELAAYHIEAGARQFAAFSKAMIEDLGENARPHLKAWYLTVRNWPGIDKTGMNTEAELDRIEARNARKSAASASPIGQDKVRHTTSVPKQPAATEPKPPGLFTGFDVPTETTKDAILRHLQDRFRRLKTIEGAIVKQGGRIDESQDAYLWEELMHGKAEERIREFEEAHVKPLIEAISKAGVKVKDVDQYLYAMHAPERNAHINEINPHFRDNGIAGSGMSDEEAQNILDDFQRRGLTDKLHGIAERVYAINEDRLRLLEDEGLENERTIQMWRDGYDHYVPLRGFDEEDGKDRPRIGRGFDIRGKESRRALGRGRKALSPLTYSITQMEESIIRAEKNDVGKAFLRLVEAHPNPDLWEISKVEYAPRYDSASGEVVYGPKPGYQYADNVLSVKVDGKPVLITIHDDGLARAMKNLGPQTSNKVLQAMAAVNRYLAGVSTSLNPEFVLTNFARDIQTALINLYGEQGARGHLKQPKGIVRKVMKDLPAAMAGVYAAERGVDAAAFGMAGKSQAVREWAKHYTEYRAAGGKVGFFGLRDVETKRKQILRELKRADGGAAAQAHKVIHLTGELISDVNTAVENAIRLSAYKNARDLGLTEAHAASLAKNLTVNFNRKGELGTIANAMYLFYNAGVQGSMRFLYALRSPKVQKIALGLVAAHFLLAMLNRWLAGDDKDGRNYWDKIPNWIKDRNLIVMKMDGSGGYYMLPLPYGYNIFNVIGNTIDGIAHGRNPLKEAGHLVGAVADSFNPIGGSDGGFLQMISPTITDPLVQLKMNENFHGGKIMPDQSQFGIQRPDSQRYWSSVSPRLQWFTEKLNEWTGGNSVRPGKIDVSPETLSFILETIAGGSGAFLKRSIDYIGNTIEGEDTPDQNVPFVRRFVGQQSAFRSPQDFHTNRDAIYMAKEEVTALRKQGRFAEADAAAKKNIALIRLFPRAKELDKQMQEDSKRIRDIRANRSLTERDKADRIKRIQQRMNDDVDRFNKGYYEKTGNTPD